MEISLLAALAREEAVDVSLSQALLIGIAYILIFGISVFTAGLTAKRLDIRRSTARDALPASQRRVEPAESAR